MSCLSSHPPSQFPSKICLACFPSPNTSAKPTEINLLEIHKNLEIKQYDPYIPPGQYPENVMETEENERVHVNPIGSLTIKNLEPQSIIANIGNSLIFHVEIYIKRRQSQEKSLQDIALRKDTEILNEEDDGRQGQEAEKECPICFDAISVKTNHELLLCKHVFHLECVKEYFIEAVNYRKIPIKCPEFQCQREILNNDIDFILGADQTALARYQKFSREFGISINPHQYLRCVTPDCEHIWSLSPKPEQQKLTCPECSQAVCRDCKKLWHPNMTCEKAMKKREKEEDFAFLKYAAKRRFQTCPKCNYVIEKIDGCNAVTCASCLTAFCYYCGSEGDGHSCKHRQKRGLRKNSCACSIF